MAEKYHCSKKTILKYAKEINYINHYRLEPTKEMIEYIVAQYCFKTAKELSKELLVSESFVEKVWMDNNLKGKGTYVYFYEKDYFETIDTNAKAYFLGLIGADGCVYKRDKDKYKNYQGALKLSLQATDEKVLNLLYKELKSNKKVTYTYRKNTGFITKIANFEISSDKIFYDLAKYNIVPQKTYIFKMPILKNEYYSSYFRGYFDGDGSIYFRNNKKIPSCCDISISGFEHNLFLMQNYLRENRINFSFIEDKRKRNSLTFGTIRANTIKDKYLFLKFIYKDCQNFFIDRKKELADNFLSLIENNEKYKQIYTNE